MTQVTVNEEPGRIVVMTGASSGLGRVAAQTLVEDGAELIVVGRSPGPAGARGVVADLSELGEVRDLGPRLAAMLDGRPIDALVLNAGGFGSGRSADGYGYDRIFVLNYLAHYVLVELLWPALGQGARVVLTTSGTHDPAEGSRVPAPRHARAPWLARPELDPGLDPSPRTAAAHAYAAAKLCVVLHARALAARDDARRRAIRVVAYDPGPTPGTGLGRGLPAPLRLLWSRFPGLLRWLMRDKANTIEDAGEALAALARGSILPREGAVYAALRQAELRWPPLSVDARRDEFVDALERDSADLVRASVGRLGGGARVDA